MARKAIVLVSDGEQQPPLTADYRERLINFSTRFKSAGGVLICVGVRASGEGFRLLRRLASPGFFLNVHGGSSSVEAAIMQLGRIAGEICAGPLSLTGFRSQIADPDVLPNLELLGVAAQASTCKLDKKGKPIPIEPPSGYYYDYGAPGYPPYSPYEPYGGGGGGGPAPGTFQNEQVTVVLNCDAPGVGPPACVTVQAGVFTSAVSQDDANRMAEYAGQVALVSATPGPCCTGDPVPATKLQDFVWSVGGAVEPPDAESFGTFSFAWDDPTATGSSEVEARPGYGGGSYATSVSWDIQFCNPYPDYDVTISFDYVATGVGLPGSGHEAAFNVFWTTGLGQSHSFVFNSTNPSGHVDFTFPVSGVGSNQIHLSAVANKVDGSGSTVNLSITNLQLRPLVPPITSQDCTQISTAPVPFHYADRPANDDFDNAESIAGASGTVSGSNLYASLETGEKMPFGLSSGRGHASIWYKWTAPSNITISFNTVGSDFDTNLAVYAGVAVDALALIAKNDDGPSPPQSQLTFNAVSGTTYLIRVAGFNNDQGNVVLNWGASTSPANDNFADAQVIAGASGTVNGSNVGATLEPSEPHTEMGNTVWYAWTAPSNGSITFDTTGSSYDTIIAAYTGVAINALSVVGYNDDGPNAPQSQMSFAVTAGTTYMIQVGGFGGLTGSIVLNWGP